jgi:hypothetical protein
VEVSIVSWRLVEWHILLQRFFCKLKGAALVYSSKVAEYNCLNGCNCTIIGSVLFCQN